MDLFNKYILVVTVCPQRHKNEWEDLVELLNEVLS